MSSDVRRNPGVLPLCFLCLNKVKIKMEVRVVHAAELASVHYVVQKQKIKKVCMVKSKRDEILRKV